MFCKQGIEFTNMAEIAEQSEISRPTLYRYFPSKHLLAEAIYLQNLDFSVDISNLKLKDNTFREFIMEMMDALNTILYNKPENLFYDAIYNIYAAFKQLDPITHQKHPFHPENWSKLTTKLQEIFKDGSIQFKGSINDFLNYVWIPYFEHIQRLAVFRYQKQNFDLLALKNHVEHYMNTVWDSLS